LVDVRIVVQGEWLRICRKPEPQYDCREDPAGVPVRRLPALRMIIKRAPAKVASLLITEATYIII